MKRFGLSMLAGAIGGIALVVLLFDYEAFWTTYELNEDGSVARVIREMDFNFLFYASAFSVAIAVAFYLVWGAVERKRHDVFLKEWEPKKREQ